jgi:hypothetical protein
MGRHPSALAHLAVGPQQAVHSGLRGEVAALVEQRRPDLGRGPVDEALAVEHPEHGCPLLPRQGVGRGRPGPAWSGERPSSPPLLSEIWAVAEARRGFVLLLNSDLEIGPDDGLPSVYSDVFQASWQSIAESIGTGLLAIRRWNYARGTDRRKATPERWGIDGFYFRADELRPFDGKPFAIGRPVWDWWLPLSYGRAKRAVFEVRHQVLFHERHPQQWSDLQWEAAMRCAVEPRHAAKAQNSRFLRGYGEQLTEELRRTLRPLPERSPV